MDEIPINPNGMDEIPKDEIPKNEILNDETHEIQCTICQNILVRPVTLLCQHTFCRECIETYVDKATKDETDEEGFQIFKDRIARCPLCKCAIVIPPNDNFVLCDLLEKHYSHEYQKALMERAEKCKKEKVKNRLRKELFNALVEETVGGNNHNQNNHNQFDHNQFNSTQNNHNPTPSNPIRTIRLYYDSPYTDTWLSRFIEKYKYLVGMLFMVGFGVIVWKSINNSVYVKSILFWVFMANYLGFFG